MPRRVSRTISAGCSGVTKQLYRPTVLTLLGYAATIAVTAGTAGFILGRAPLLGQVIPVHFGSDGAPDRWLRFSYALVLLPVWIQLALATVFGAVAGLLLYRVHPRAREGAAEDEVVRQERERMLATAEAVSLLTTIWVTFQAVAALRIMWLWQWWHGNLGDIYFQSLVVAIVASVIVGIRAAVNMRHAQPAHRETLDANWRMDGVYFNPQDPSLFVPLRSGTGWTLNFGRPRALLIVLLFVLVGIGVPIVILRLILGQ
jgi:uncharacterized membrane protein